MKTNSVEKNLKVLLYLWGLVFITREIVTYFDILPGKYILTPAITAAAAGIAILSLAKEVPDRYRAMIIAGLLTALVGDTLLMIVEVDLLQYGIVFFLLTHFLYIFAFAEGYSFKKWHGIPLVLLLLVVAIFYSRVHGKTGGLDVSVLAYMTIISTMFFFALTRYDRIHDRRAVILLLGASLFLTSDLILAINAFLIKIPKSTIFTWATYGPAQLFIALSCFEISGNREV